MSTPAAFTNRRLSIGRRLVTAVCYRFAQASYPYNYQASEFLRLTSRPPRNRIPAHHPESIDEEGGEHRGLASTQDRPAFVRTKFSYTLLPFSTSLLASGPCDPSQQRYRLHHIYQVRPTYDSSSSQARYTDGKLRVFVVNSQNTKPMMMTFSGRLSAPREYRYRPMSHVSQELTLRSVGFLAAAGSRRNKNVAVRSAIWAVARSPTSLDLLCLCSGRRAINGIAYDTSVVRVVSSPRFAKSDEVAKHDSQPWRLGGETRMVDRCL
ncbi:hypothetical protein AC578_5182 [Pseudocercospora eumusae]|uniref:Uncharacterized protein n=1 Tax=Pseudocercospora eumusae TaxID=321146 RepID=A0A139HMQ0_9PEZI|nr:hypothetical protein AC578_5182 [Pseudocercospora eumusae]